MYSLICTLEEKVSESSAGKWVFLFQESSGKKKKVDSISVNDPDKEDVLVC